MIRVKIWFNEKLEKVIYESKQISESYFNEHKKNIKNDIILSMMNLQMNKFFILADKIRITEYLSYFAES